MHTIDLVNLAFSKLKALGVELRFVRGDGLSSGLCRIAQKRVLFLNDASSAQEQLNVIANAFQTLQCDLNKLPTPLRNEIEARLQNNVSFQRASA